MYLNVTNHIKVDFHDNKYILVNAKQHDRMLRSILVSCYDKGEFFKINKNDNLVCVRCRKPDGLGVFNTCEVTYDGKILVELTEQMLSVSGICAVDLVIIKKNSAIEPSSITSTDDGEGNITLLYLSSSGDKDGNVVLTVTNDGKIITDEDSYILSTMTFYINVVETAFDNSEVESSYEYNALNDLLIKANADYTCVIEACKTSEENAKISEQNALNYESNTYQSLVLAREAMENAQESEANALASANSASTSEANALVSATNAEVSENNVKTSEANAKTSETNAYDYSIVSQRYAVGGTNTATNEDTDNAKYYYQQTKGISDSLTGVISPKGTITFEELATADKATGYLYIIKNSFITDDTFIDGAGIEYPTGTAVYYTIDGYWACFDGYARDVATVSEIKDYLGI